MNKEEYDKYLSQANFDIQNMEERKNLKEYVASLLYDNDKKEQEIKQLKETLKGTTHCYDEEEHQKLKNEVVYAKVEIERLKDLCNRYEEEHNTAFKLWTQKMEEMPDYEERMKLKKEVDRLNNIINQLEKDLNEAYNELHHGELVNGRELINNIYQELKALKENNKDD